MSEFIDKFLPILLQGTLDTLYMTFFATLFAYIIGLPLGVLLSITKKGGICANSAFNAIFGWVLNIVRSLPFVILMFFVIPFTRLIVGVSIGATAAIVPLVISAAPFIARMVETSLDEVDNGVIEAAQAMGANNFQIITRVLIRESIPSLLRGLSIISITILGYTAVTDYIGAGGLGSIAYRFGKQRYEPSVMYATIVILIILVSIIQSVFNYLSHKADKRNR